MTESRDSLYTWTSGKVDFKMGLRLGIRQNIIALREDKALTDSHQKDAKFVIFLVKLGH